MTARKGPAPQMPPLGEIAALGQTEYEREFLQREFEPGLQYYLDRLDRLMFSGGTLLDAGCGAGQWSLAAAQRFDRVDALDVSPQRLDILRTIAGEIGATTIDVCRGSIEHLPYSSASFDAVLCYGVIMFTNAAQVMAEFFRVLKPGGRLYLCASADGWSRYLIRERGLTDSHAGDAGRETLYNTYWRRALAAGLEGQLVRAARQLRSMWPRWVARLRLGPDRRIALSPRRERVARRMGRRCLHTSAAGEQLWLQISRDCGAEMAERLSLDAWLVANELGTPTVKIVAEAFTPAEMQRLAEGVGFEEFQWAVESGLLCDWLKPGAPAKYAGYYDNALSVWEALITRPDHRLVAPADPQWHIAAAGAAREDRLYVESADPTVLSNGSWHVYPHGMVSHVQKLAVQLGGGRYLASLARRIVGDAATGEQAARRLIEFVQRSIFRDPVSQPILADGALPDSLTILLSSRGRCGHTSQLLADLFRLAGFDARVRALGNHVVCEALVDDRWIVADADAFKNGVLPVSRERRLLTMEEIVGEPYQLDKFAPTGWWIRSSSRFARGRAGGRVSGYVDALDPDRRGFVSGYYVAAAKGFPPPVPTVTRFQCSGDALVLEWTPSVSPDGGKVEYLVAIGSESRRWTYDSPGDHDEILRPPCADVASATTREARVEIPLRSTPGPLYAAVTAVSLDRLDIEPATFFWPSEELRYQAAGNVTDR